MRADLTFGVIGLGRMGMLHATNLRGAIVGARLKVAAVSPEDRKRLEAEGSAPAPLVDVDELINDPEINAVAVVSPTANHREHIERCAAAGKAVFTEKQRLPAWIVRRQDARKLAAQALPRRCVPCAAIPFSVGPVCTPSAARSRIWSPIATPPRAGSFALSRKMPKGRFWIGKSQPGCVRRLDPALERGSCVPSSFIGMRS